MICKDLNILGIRGFPAAHGGFETFADNFARFLLQEGWRVNIYCQEESLGPKGKRRWEDEYSGVHRTHFATRFRGALGTVEFDLRCVLDVLFRPGVDLVLGYNTAIFNILQRALGRYVVMNMDGIEWQRQKWGLIARNWLKMNEWIGGKTCSQPIADHPEIATHLLGRGIGNVAIVPYGSDEIGSADPLSLKQWNLESGKYFISIARIEPENSLLEIIEGFKAANTDFKLVILGNTSPDKNAYHAAVRSAGDGSVYFAGAIYDPDLLRTLRLNCRAYIHGHQVGGTNPSLVEALGAGNAVIAHDNRFNRWTAGDGALFFSTRKECADAIRQLSCDDGLARELGHRSLQRHKNNFRFDIIHGAYLEILRRAEK